MKKEATVVMLPTKDNNAPIDNQECIEAGLSCKEIPQFHKYKPQHLYFTTDDKIKEGDWYIDDVNAVRQAVTSDPDYWP